MGCPRLLCLATLLYMSSPLFQVGPGATQLVLSDGMYETIQLQQTFNYGGNTYSQLYAGYGMENSSFVTIPVNSTPELSSSSNVNITGRWAFQFTGSPLFQVGPGATQLGLSDGMYETIQLQQTFSYGGNTYSQLNLSMDGYVAFFIPNIDDEVPNQNLNKDIIAPLWTDLDSDSGGKWTYEQATSGPLIDQTNQEINRMFPIVYFSASWVFVSTWENVPLEFSGFQAGYGMESSSFVTIPVNSAPELSSSSNVNIPGRWAFQFTGSPLFQVGPGATQLFLSDGMYETIQLQQTFNYGGNTYSQLYLSMDGYVAFFIPNIDDEVPKQNLNKDIIAPLWTDLDSDSGGRWTYEQATSGPLIAQTNHEINRMFPNVYFSASWVFVSTWENVPLEFSGFQGATLQVILASDGGGQSFILMNYGTIPTIPSPYWLAGYGMQNNIFVTIPVNSAPELSSSSNVNIPGRWAFQFTGSPLFQVGPGATQLVLSDGMYETIQLQQTFNYGGITYSQLNAGYGMEHSNFFTIPVNSSPELSSSSNVNITGRWAFQFTDSVETCSGSTGSLSLSRCQLFEAGYSVDVLHLNDPSCKGQVENNRLVFYFDSNANMCGTTLKNNNTHIIFENSIGTVNGIGLISRSGGLSITFSCVYPLIQSISMPTDISATGSIISKDLSTEGSYQISMIPYTDATFLVPFGGNVTLQINHQMYIAVEVNPFDSNQIALVLDNCWATPANQSDYSIRWDLIINECPNPNDDTVEVLQNGVSTSSHFSFRMFTFTSFSSKIYLHCQVHLCLKESGNCELPCTGNLSRKRRSVDFYDSAAISMEF
ncbi:hypothetical protein C0J50_22645 [Silurus asotus]|uniref:Alpha-tectorin-like n=1 Tax=Silurus asotus TaxID=30991 RepID=A0AAD5FIK4_SILAS|nr:hypothetical protein C0J50_22645 [Silurus asotus]